MGSVHQICLRWNNHQTNFPKVFNDLRMSKDLVDVTLCCEGRKLKAHKLVLSACSPYFQSLFTEVPCKHPVIFFRDVPYAELESIVNYMYKGEVSVAKDNLDQFLKTAESLQVKGLIMESEGDHVPAVKETVVPSPAKIPRKTLPEAHPTPKHITKEATWSQSYVPQPKSHTPVHKEPSVQSSQATFTPTSVPVQTSFTPASNSGQATFIPTSISVQTIHQQPPTPQSLGGGSSSLQSPAAQEDDDDDVIIEPMIKFETIDQNVNESVGGAVGDSAKTGSHMEMETDYITGDDMSESFSHEDSRLTDDIDSIMSSINNQQGSMMEMGMGPGHSQDQGEDFTENTRSKSALSAQGKRLSLEQRMDMFAAFDRGWNVTQLSQHFAITTSSVYKLLKNRKRHTQQFETQRRNLEVAARTFRPDH